MLERLGVRPDVLAQQIGMRAAKELWARWPELGRGLVAEQEAVSACGTRKLRLGLAEGGAVETVLIPGKGRTTVCISSQVGCGRACIFCMTATMGLQRNLSAAEMVGQVCRAAQVAQTAGLPPVRNVVLMGMGEPLDNLDAVRRALEVLTHPWGPGLAPRHLTLSTVGTHPRRIALLRDVPAQIAWSLHAAEDALRASLIPTTRHSLATLRAAFLQVLEGTRRCLFVEVTLMRGVNDGIADAQRMAAFLRPFGRRCRVNLLPLNPGRAGLSPSTTAEAFRDVLRQAGYFCMVRRPRGDSEQAACGQLVA